jgi:hypothetical protein
MTSKVVVPSPRGDFAAVRDATSATMPFLVWRHEVIAELTRRGIAVRNLGAWLARLPMWWTEGEPIWMTVESIAFVAKRASVEAHADREIDFMRTAYRSPELVPARFRITTPMGRAEGVVMSRSGTVSAGPGALAWMQLQIRRAGQGRTLHVYEPRRGHCRVQHTAGANAPAIDVDLRGATVEVVS